MKNLKLLFTTLLLILSAAQAKADAGKNSEAEVRVIGGQSTVLISQTLAESIHKLLLSNKSKGEKAQTIRSLFFITSLVLPDEEGSFCQVAGETYATVNKSAKEMTEQCSERLSNAKSDFFDGMEDYKFESVEQARLQLSALLAVYIMYNM